MKEIQAIVRALTEAPPSPAALATLVQVNGSSYRRAGARLLLFADGRRHGSISGGCLEQDVLARAQQVIASGTADLVVYDTTSENDLVWGVGLGCQGVVRVLIEPLEPRPAWAVQLARNFADRQPSTLLVNYGPGRRGTRVAESTPAPAPDIFMERLTPPLRLILFGAGDDAQPLARLGDEMGWLVTVADPRPAFATRERFPTAERIEVGAADQLVDAVAADGDTVAVVMTHHYIYDVPILRGLLPLRLTYLGLLGPRQRAEKILADLAQAGAVITPPQRERLHAPVGLDLGADGAAPVAMSIVAEVLSVLTGRNARPLRQRTGPIH